MGRVVVGFDVDSLAKLGIRLQRIFVTLQQRSREPISEIPVPRQDDRQVLALLSHHVPYAVVVRDGGFAVARDEQRGASAQQKRRCTAERMSRRFLHGRTIVY